MKKSIRQRTVVRFYDEDGNIVGEEISERILEGKEAEGIQLGTNSYTYILENNGYLS